jgi:hypothetical protein
MSSATRDLPQASSLATVRDFVAAIAAGHDRDLREAGAHAGLSARHADYYGVAATVTLELARVGSDRLELTPLGRDLLATRARTHAELAALDEGLEMFLGLAPV